MADITFAGLTFTVPDEKDQIPVKAIEAWEEERLVSFVKALVKEDQWAEFMAGDPVMDDFSALAKAIGDVYGGESSASRGSSDNTAGLLKPTSNASTASHLPPPTPVAR